MLNYLQIQACLYREKNTLVILERCSIPAEIPVQIWFMPVQAGILAGTEHHATCTVLLPVQYVLAGTIQY